MLPIDFGTSNFVDADGVMVLQLPVFTPATLPLEAQDATPLRGFDIQATRPIQLSELEEEQFANWYSRYLRQVNEITKVSMISFTNWLLKQKTLSRVRRLETSKRPDGPCYYGERCPTCKGMLTDIVCRAAMTATIAAQDALIGLTGLAARGSMRMDEKEAYFWPTRRLLDCLCQPGTSTAVLRG